MAIAQHRNYVMLWALAVETLTHSKHSNTHSVAYSHRHLNKFTLFQLPDHKNPIKSQHIDTAHCKAGPGKRGRDRKETVGGDREAKECGGRRCDLWKTSKSASAITV